MGKKFDKQAYTRKQRVIINDRLISLSTKFITLFTSNFPDSFFFLFKKSNNNSLRLKYLKDIRIHSFHVRRSNSWLRIVKNKYCTEKDEYV